LGFNGLQKLNSQEIRATNAPLDVLPRPSSTDVDFGFVMQWNEVRGGKVMVRTNFMGHVTCEAKVENAIDLALARTGKLAESGVRTIDITDALVDTGASTLGLSTAMLRQLGLDKPTSTRRSRNTTGVYDVKLYGPVRLTIHERDITLDAMEVDDGCPVLIGQIPLEHLQLLVDMANHRLEKSPANGGEWIMDMF
jgi:predicted aspartyl protease